MKEVEEKRMGANKHEPASQSAGRTNMEDSSTQHPGPNGSNRKEIYVKEELKIAVKLTLDQFRYDEEKKG